MSLNAALTHTLMQQPGNDSCLQMICYYFPPSWMRLSSLSECGGLVGYISQCEWQGQVDFPNPAATESPTLWLQHPVWKSVQDRASRSCQRGESPRTPGPIQRCHRYVCGEKKNPVMLRRLKNTVEGVEDECSAPVKAQRSFQTKNPFKAAEEGSSSPFRVLLDPISLYTLFKQRPRSPQNFH